MGAREQTNQPQAALLLLPQKFYKLRMVLVVCEVILRAVCLH